MSAFIGAVGIVAGIATIVLRERLASSGLELFGIPSRGRGHRLLVAANLAAGVFALVVGLALVLDATLV